MSRLILASGSPRRIQLLREAKFEPEVVPADEALETLVEEGADEPPEADVADEAAVAEEAVDVDETVEAQPAHDSDETPNEEEGA